MFPNRLRPRTLAPMLHQRKGHGPVSHARTSPARNQERFAYLPESSSTSIFSLAPDAYVTCRVYTFGTAARPRKTILMMGPPHSKRSIDEQALGVLHRQQCPREIMDSGQTPAGIRSILWLYPDHSPTSIWSMAWSGSGWHPLPAAWQGLRRGPDGWPKCKDFQTLLEQAVQGGTV